MAAKGLSLSHITAGFIAVMTGYTSSVVIVLQAAAAAGADPAQTASWLWALGLAMGVTSLGFSLRYKIPVLTAWSTPGAALLATALSGFSTAEAYGAFIVCALLTLISGVTGGFARLMHLIPLPLANAMLAGILLQFGLGIFTSLGEQPLLSGAMLVIFLAAKRLMPSAAMLLVLLGGVLIAAAQGMLSGELPALTLTQPHFTAPAFSGAAILGVALPLFIVTMTSQNLPGIAVLRSHGYTPPVSALLSGTGLVNLLLAPFGGYSCNLAAITAAICMSEDVDRDPAQRYKAAAFAGLFYLLAGLFGAAIVALFALLPGALVMTLAGLALLGTIGSSLHNALSDSDTAQAGLIAFLVTASGLSLFGIGSAFWGLVLGVLAQASGSVRLNRRKSA
ncbi:benzoate/H(+) symporter BenE family transporter [Granulosicoccaceae sp. 1_MG-2023]|nr:benzoate/H(+) symporter BenE family transporter [Granulosicoccaceae sp. 1_MG-2023]